MDRPFFNLADQVDTSVWELNRVSVSIKRTWQGLEEELNKAAPDVSTYPMSSVAFAIRARGYIEQFSIFIDKLSHEIDVLDQAAAQAWAASKQEEAHGEEEKR